MNLYLNRKFLLLIPIALLLGIYFIFDPIDTGWMPQCLFHKLTGLQCMGCGSQRVVHALLHADIKEAWMANAFMVCAIPFLLFYLWLELRRKRFAALYARMHSRWMIFTISFLLLAWFAVRNILSI